MDMQAAFMEDICANPDDDTPRLVFADWLEENGEAERAEFIRAQIAAYRLPKGPEREGLEERATALHLRNRGKWFAEPAGTRCERERGFPSRLTVGYTRLIEMGGVPRQPFRSVVLEAHYDQGRRLTAQMLDGLRACRGLERVTGIRIWRPDVDQAVLLAFLREGRLPALDWLILESFTPEAGLLDWVVQPENAPRLESFGLFEATINEQGWGQIRPLLPRLRSLWLDHNRGHVDWAALGSPTDLSRLRSLVLNRLDGAIRGLSGSLSNPTLRGLEHLGLNANGLGNRIADLLPPGRFPHLQSLHLDFVGMTASGLRGVCAGLPPAGMRQLGLQSNHLGDEGATVLADCSALSALEYADLQEYEIGEAGTLALASGVFRTALLHFEGNDCSPEALERLRERADDITHE
jgi:uncharacterized protein (TIGR02996 family)